MEWCNKISSASSRLVCEYDSQSTQEGCRSLSCDKLEKVKQSYSVVAFQNGGTIFTKGNSSKNGYTRKIDFKDAKFSKICDIQMERSALSVSMSMFWTEASSKNFYKTFESSNFFTETK